MRRLEVQYVNRSCALLRGYGSRDLVVELKGRAPVWATRDRAWVVQPSTADDVIAAAEARGCEVRILGERPRQAPAPLAPEVDSQEADPGRGLW